jgi:hypothetical protein
MPHRYRGSGAGMLPGPPDGVPHSCPKRRAPGLQLLVRVHDPPGYLPEPRLGIFERRGGRTDLANVSAATLACYRQIQVARGRPVAPPNLNPGQPAVELRAFTPRSRRRSGDAPSRIRRASHRRW